MTETRERKLTAVEMLDAVPMRNVNVREEDRGGGEWRLFVPLKRRWFTGPPFSWLMPLSRERVVALDSLGWEVWRACDGQTRTEQIVEAFAQSHGLTFHEARTSVMQFLRMLTARGLIVMVGNDPEGDHS